MRKKFTVKKVILIIILILIVSAVGFVANGFNGNPISKAFAKSEYKRYVKETYPNSDFKVSEVSYNFKDGNYVAQVTSENKKLKFWVIKRYDDVIDDEYRDQPTLEDNDRGIKFSDTIRDEIMKEVVEVNNIDVGQYIYVDMRFPQGKYDESSSFTRDLDEKFKVQVSLNRAKPNEKASNDEVEGKKENKEAIVTNKVFLSGKEDPKEVAPKPAKDKEVENKEKIIVVDEEFLDSAYKIKEIIINMGYTGLTGIEFEFQDKEFNTEYILLNKDQFNTPKNELVNFKIEKTSMHEKGGHLDEFLKLTEDIKVSLKDIKNIEDIYVYENILGGNRGNIEANLKILNEVKPTKEELAKEAFEIKEIIKKQHPEIKCLEINFYEYGELNAKGGRWGQYYGSIFIGNEFAPWTVTQEDVNTKLKVWENL